MGTERSSPLLTEDPHPGNQLDPWEQGLDPHPGNQLDPWEHLWEVTKYWEKTLGLCRRKKNLDLSFRSTLYDREALGNCFPSACEMEVGVLL